MSVEIIHKKIFSVRAQKIMLDFDLSELYEVETRVLNQSVKRNIDKFPEDFMFQLSPKEWEILKLQLATSSEHNNDTQAITGSNKKALISQIVTSKKETRGGTQKMPFAFTEPGVTMLASVLKSKKATAMNIAIVRAFIAMRYFANNNKELFEQMNDLRKEIQTRLGDHDMQLNSIYTALENLLDKKEQENDKKEKWNKRERIGFKKG